MSDAGDDATRGEFALDRHSLDPRTEVVEVAGEIDLFSAAELEAALSDAIDAGSRWVIVDLAAASYIGFPMLGALIAAARRLLTVDGGVGVVSGDADVRRLFEITGLDHVVPVEAELDDALVALRGGR